MSEKDWLELPDIDPHGSVTVFDEGHATTASTDDGKVGATLQFSGRTLAVIGFESMRAAQHFVNQMLFVLRAS